MTRNVKMSAEKHLTIWSSSDAGDTSDDNIENSDDIKTKMMKIINIAISGQGLENLRTKSENIDRNYYYYNFRIYY